jgi:hypothetical protein
MIDRLIQFTEIIIGYSDKQLIWARHVMRMEESDPARKVICTKAGGTGDRKKTGQR